MPTLNWIGKEKVINHHQDVPYRILEEQYTYSNGKEDNSTSSENKIIHGDNLAALKSLLPVYEGRIKCIYIDPPYNTGEEKWVYNDNVNHPKLEKWLGDVVGKESEDLSRHDKWLCMMYPRIKLLYKLLHDEGSFFVSIDDNEMSSLKLILDEVFGRKGNISTIVWQKRYSRENREAIGDVHEYILVYSKSPKAFKERRNLIPANEKQLKVYRNSNNDPNGRWRPIPMTAQAGHATKDQFYPITAPGGKIHYPPQGRCWGIAESTFKKLLIDDRIYFGLDNNSQPNIIRYLSEVEGLVPWTWWNHEEVGHTDEAKKEIYNILGKKVDFDTPKPVRLIDRILRIATKSNDIILDSFAGTATTAHAVMQLNKDDGGNRKFIIIEMEDYCESITVERMKRVISGYTYKGSNKDVLYSKKINLTTLKKGPKIVSEIESLKLGFKDKYDELKTVSEDNHLTLLGIQKSNVKIEGTRGDFTYFKLGQPILLENEIINEEISIEKIEEYVWYSETKESYSRQDEKYLLGIKNDTAFYFYYKKNKLTTLDESYLRTLNTKAQQYIIYADLCLLDKSIMDKYKIIFKKIPRDITRF